MVSTSNICIRCFSYHGQKEQCKKPIVIACSNCYLMNYLTKSCCAKPPMEDNMYTKSLHLAGSPTPRFFVDVNIFGRAVAAMVNTNLSISKIDVAVLHYLKVIKPKKYTNTQDLVVVPMYVNDRRIVISCQTGQLNDNIRIELGVDFLLNFRLKLTLNGVNIARQHGHPLSSPRSRFYIDVKVGRKLVEAVIDTSLLQSRIHPVILNDSNNNNLGQEASAEITWDNTSVMLRLKLVTVMKSPLLLGMDYLMKSDFILFMGRLQIETKGTWVSSHQDMMEYAYNHPYGTALKDLLVVLRRDMNYDMPRPILNCPLVENPENNDIKRKEKVD
ncbi:hypothetical protein ACFFRR_008348 [Megaselia abdita]